jgi:hypothetical protein
LLTALAILEELRRKHSDDELKTTVRNPPYMVSAISLIEFDNYLQLVVDLLDLRQWPTPSIVQQL